MGLGVWDLGVPGVGIWECQNSGFRPGQQKSTSKRTCPAPEILGFWGVGILGFGIWAYGISQGDFLRGHCSPGVLEVGIKWSSGWFVWGGGRSYQNKGWDPPFPKRSSKNKGGIPLFPGDPTKIGGGSPFFQEILQEIKWFVEPFSKNLTENSVGSPFSRKPYDKQDSRTLYFPGDPTINKQFMGSLFPRKPQNKVYGIPFSRRPYKIHSQLPQTPFGFIGLGKDPLSLFPGSFWGRISRVREGSALYPRRFLGSGPCRVSRTREGSALLFPAVFGAGAGPPRSR